MLTKTDSMHHLRRYRPFTNLRMTEQAKLCNSVAYEPIDALMKEERILQYNLGMRLVGQREGLAAQMSRITIDGQPLADIPHKVLVRLWAVLRAGGHIPWSFQAGVRA